MFSVHLYLSISLSIESLSTIKSPAAAGGKRVHRQKEKSIESQATQTMEQINSSEKWKWSCNDSTLSSENIKTRTHT